MKKLFLLGLLACAFAGTPEQADAKTSNVLNYQGTIKSATTQMPVNKSMSMTFKIYNDSKGGNALWTETNVVSVKAGYFNVFLGQTQDLDIDFSKELYLEVTLDNGDVLERTRLAATPFSFRAGISSEADTATVAKGVVDGSIAWNAFKADALKAGGALKGTYPNPTLNYPVLIEELPKFGIGGDKIAPGQYTHIQTSPIGNAYGDMEGSQFPYLYLRDKVIQNKHIQPGTITADKLGGTVAADSNKVLVVDKDGKINWGPVPSPLNQLGYGTTEGQMFFWDVATNSWKLTHNIAPTNGQVLKYDEVYKQFRWQDDNGFTLPYINDDAKSTNNEDLIRINKTDGNSGSMLNLANNDSKGQAAVKIAAQGDRAFANGVLNVDATTNANLYGPSKAVVVNQTVTADANLPSTGLEVKNTATAAHNSTHTGIDATSVVNGGKGVSVGVNATAQGGTTAFGIQGQATGGTVTNAGVMANYGTTTKDTVNAALYAASATGNAIYATGTPAATKYVAQVKSKAAGAGRGMYVEGASVNNIGMLDATDQDEAVLVVKNTSTEAAPAWATAIGAKGHTAIKTYGDIWANSAIGAQTIVGKDKVIIGDPTGLHTTLTPPAAAGAPMVFDTPIQAPKMQTTDLVVGTTTTPGTATINGTLTVTGTTNFTDMHLSGNLAVDGNTTLGKAGNATTLTVNSTPTFAENATFNKNIAVTGNAAVTGNETVGGTLGVTGNTALGGTLTVADLKATILGGTLKVKDNATFDKNIAVTGNSAITGNETIGGTLGVTGATTLGNTLTVAGATTINNTLHATGNATLDANLAVGGNAAVTGNETVGGTLGVTGATTLGNTLTVAGATTINNTLHATGNTTLGADLAVTGNETVGGTLTVADGKKTTLGGDLEVKGNSDLKGTLTVADSKATVLGGTLEVKDNATFDKNLTVKGNTNIGDNATVDLLTIDAITTLNGDLTANGSATFTGTTNFTNSAVFTSAVEFKSGGKVTGGSLNPDATGGNIVANKLTIKKAPQQVDPVYGAQGENATDHVDLYEQANPWGTVFSDVAVNAINADGTFMVWDEVGQKWVYDQVKFYDEVKMTNNNAVPRWDAATGFLVDGQMSDNPTANTVTIGQTASNQVIVNTTNGSLTVNGNTTLGDANTDALTVNANTTFADGTTTNVNSSTIALGNANTDALTVNATSTFANAATLNINSDVVNIGNAAADAITVGGVMQSNATGNIIANNIKGGLALEVPYQTAANTTTFAVAPTAANTALTYDGTNLIWKSSTSNNLTVNNTIPRWDNTAKQLINGSMTDDGTTVTDTKDFAVTGNTVLTGSLTGNGNVVLGSDNADVVTINGNTTVADGTSLTANGNVTLGNTAGDAITVNGTTTFNQPVTFANAAALTVNSDAITLGNAAGDVLTVNATTTIADGTSFAANGPVTLGNAPTDAISVLGTATFAQNVTAPQFNGNLNGELVGGGANTLVYQTAANTTDFLATANSSVLTTNATGVPTWAATLAKANLPAAIAYEDEANAFTAANTFAGTSTFNGALIANDAVILGNAAGDAITVNGTTTFNQPVTLADAATLTVNSNTITLGNATGDAITVNGTIQTRLTYATATVATLGSLNTATAPVVLYTDAGNAAILNSNLPAGVAGQVMYLVNRTGAAITINGVTVTTANAATLICTAANTWAVIASN